MQLDERKEITNYLRRLRFNSMQDAKSSILYLLQISESRTPTINDLLLYLDMDPISYGDNWGWFNLYHDILSTKYGAKAIWNQRRRVSTFSLQLPPVKKF